MSAILGAVRRGSILAPRVLRATSSTPLRSSKSFCSLLRSSNSVSRLAAASIPHFQTTRWQSNSAAALAEEEAVEGEIENEINAQHPPSDFEINQKIHQGPITKFQELADRNLVHKNVVETIVSGMKIETMTEVQSMTINETLKGADV